MNDDISRAIQALPDRVNADHRLTRIGRYCSTEFLLAAGEASFHIQVERGRITQVLPGPRRMRAWSFALRGAPGAWRHFWQPVPAVGFNDIFAMCRYGHLLIDGDVGPLLEHLRFIKEVIALPRGDIAGDAP